MSEQRSGPGRRPDVKIAIKAKEPKGAPRFYIAAGWREDGKLRLKFDRDIVSITMKDGSVLDCANLYIDLYDDADGPRQGTPRPGASTGGTSGFGGSAKHSAPADNGADFGDDDVPFRQPFSLPI